MNRAVHFVGFKDGRVNNAIRVFGRPDFFHRVWDKRAIAEVADNDVVVFADRNITVNPFTWDDSARF